MSKTYAWNYYVSYNSISICNNHFYICVKIKYFQIYKLLNKKLFACLLKVMRWKELLFYPLPKLYNKDQYLPILLF